MVRIAILVLAFWSIAVSAQGPLAGRNVSVAIANPEDLSPAEWQGANPSLTSAPIALNGDETIYTALQANGIYPDSEAFALVYDLNPGLRDLKDVKAGTGLELPRVAAESDLAKLRAKGNLVRISVDPELRNALSESAKTLKELAESSQGVTNVETQRQVKSLAAWYVQIDKSYRRRTGPPLRRETLQQLSDEAVALNGILQTAARTKQPPSEDDQAQVGAIYDDLTKLMPLYGQPLGNVAPKGEGACDVVVNIVGGDPTQSAALRIYYTFNGLYRDPPEDPPVRSSEWKQLGSGHSERLLSDKNYKLWVARDGDPGHPLTAPFRMENACEANPSKVDLSVKAKAQ